MKELGPDRGDEGTQKERRKKEKGDGTEAREKQDGRAEGEDLGVGKGKKQDG